MAFFKQPSFSNHYIQILKLNYLAWLTYFLIYFFYAYFWRQLSQSDDYQYTPLSSLLWFAKEWAAWLIISPIMLWVLERSYGNTSLPITLLIVVIAGLLVALIARLLLRTGEYSSGWMETMIFTLPKYCPASVGIALAWYLFRKQRDSALSQENLPKAKDAEIQVEHKGLRQSLKTAQIIFLKSAGNYVEIVCKNGTYLQRGTLKQLLDTLPQETFIQVHRSYAINLSELEKLGNNENGSSIATLNNQQKIPVSKRYKSKLKSITLSR